MKSIKRLLCVVLSITMLASMATAIASESDAKALSLGDVDGDTYISMRDVVEIQRYVADLTDLSDDQKKAADVDEPYENVNMLDVVTIQKYIAQLISEFPAESREFNDSENDIQHDTDISSSSDIIDTSTDTLDTSSDTEFDTTVDVVSIKDVLSASVGANLTTRGQVCYVYDGNTVIIEEVEEDGTVNGLMIFDKEGIAGGFYELNSIVEVTGTTKLYNGSNELTDISSIAIMSKQNKPIAPVESTVSELKEHINTVAVIKNCKLGAYDSNSSNVTDATGTVVSYKPAMYPDGVTEGSAVDLVCLPTMYKDAVQIRVADKSNYMPLGSFVDTDSETASETDTSTSTDTNTSPIEITGNRVVFGEPITSLDKIVNRPVAITISNEALSAAEPNSSYAGALDIKTVEGKLTASSDCVYIIEHVAGSYLLKSHATGKYLTNNVKTESVFSSEITEAAYMSITFASDLFEISSINQERELALFIGENKNSFRWYVSTAQTSLSRDVKIYPIVSSYNEEIDTSTDTATDTTSDTSTDTSGAINANQKVYLTNNATSVDQIIGKKVVLTIKNCAVIGELSGNNGVARDIESDEDGMYVDGKAVFTVVFENDSYYLYNEVSKKYYGYKGNNSYTSLYNSICNDAMLNITYNSSNSSFLISSVVNTHELSFFSSTGNSFRWYEPNAFTDRSRDVVIYLVD
ncbi:MAG: dockerin type I repeat-containing protein [Clostridia bacterium]|nr:dockerin type I repeat-containing protein [Clostridia bacterium]